ncbi:MAG: stage V sporulation protein AC [Clostridiales bacterium]|nr:stage V sporulation protein AC [Candidatus Equinaster intestinalis]
MKMQENEYSKLVERFSPASPKIKDFLWAFCVGGLICAIGQGIKEIYLYFGLEEDITKMLVPSTLVFVAALLTGLKIFDKIAKHAGAGTLVPITGFANAVVSPAIEFKNEGFVLGVGAKIFSIAGPVILYGTAASVVYGIIYYFCR